LANLDEVEMKYASRQNKLLDADLLFDICQAMLIAFNEMLKFKAILV
jgi:hypothetical protein